LSVIARDQGDWQGAAALSMESAALFRKLGDKQGFALSLVTRGVARYQLGFQAEAIELHRESIALFGELENKREIAEWLQVLALIACTHGQPIEAARLFGSADSAFEELGSTMGPGTNPRYQRYVAEIREALGETAFAAAWAEGCAMPLEDAMAEALASVHPGAGQHDTPLSRFEPASEPPLVAASSRPSSEEVRSAGLTRREQEVVALLARGLTNREIAAELTIAERTAETHVSRILAKLNLTRRAQLTAWAVQHDLGSVRPA
jgi:non-specific serine/threonine protein kinase